MPANPTIEDATLAARLARIKGTHALVIARSGPWNWTKNVSFTVYSQNSEFKRIVNITDFHLFFCRFLKG